MGKPKKDLTGQKFEKLTAIEYIGNSQWKCLCDCGNETIISTKKWGKTKSCGCLRTQKREFKPRNSFPKEDLTGQKFGYLKPVEYIKGGKWKCLCDCGNETIVDTRNLKAGHTKSCGCLVYSSKNNVHDMTNYETDFLKVIERDGSTENGIAKWKCKCKKCGRYFTTTGSWIRAGEIKSCGCINSLNEQRIIKMLEKANIKYQTQYTFSDLKGESRKLRFDFAIFNEDGTLHHLIEYNGLQHYEKPNGSWENSFQKTQAYDKKKIDYCKQHNIELRIIRYDQEYSLQDLI